MSSNNGNLFISAFMIKQCHKELESYSKSARLKLKHKQNEIKMSF